MSDLRTAAQRVLAEYDNDSVGFKLFGALEDLRAALAEPCPPPEAKTEAERLAYAAGWWAALSKR